AANLGVAILKDTSLASAIATPELMSRAYDLVGQTWRPMHIYLLAALIYMMMCLPLIRLVRYLERGARRGEAEAPGGTGSRARWPSSADFTAGGSGDTNGTDESPTQT